MKTVYAFIILLAFASCEKQDELIGTDHADEHATQAQFIISLGPVNTMIETQDWPTVLCTYEDYTVSTDAYLYSPYTKSWHCIYYRTYMVHAFIDSKWEYMGWNVIQDTNYIDTEHLNKGSVTVNGHTCP